MTVENDIVSKRRKIHKDKHRMRRYGISPREYDSLFEKQYGNCALCGFPSSKYVNGRAEDLAVDHCHYTGIVRGLLCFNCNSSIGKFHDHPELLRKAADYVEFFREKGMAKDPGFLYVDKRKEKTKKAKRSLPKCVYYTKCHNAYRSRVWGKDYREHTIGYFDTAEQAAEAVDIFYNNGQLLTEEVKTLLDAIEGKRLPKKNGLPVGVGAVKDNPNKFVSRIRVGKKMLHLGTFETIEEAQSAYEKAYVAKREGREIETNKIKK